MVIRSAVVRKELAGLRPTDPAGEHGYERGLYSPQMKDRVYSECLRRAEAVLRCGGRVIVDASFSKERWRAQLLDNAVMLGIPATLMWCQTSPEVAKYRLEQRERDASDADWQVYLASAPRWEPESWRTRRHLIRLDTSGSVACVVDDGIRLITGAYMPRSAA